jgi:hypothetical protein
LATEEMCKAAKKARKAEEKKSSTTSCKKLGYIPERSAELVTYNHVLLHKNIIHNLVSLMCDHKFNVVFVYLSSSAGVCTWTQKKVECVLEYINTAENGSLFVLCS